MHEELEPVRHASTNTSAGRRPCASKADRRLCVATTVLSNRTNHAASSEMLTAHTTAGDVGCGPASAATIIFVPHAKANFHTCTSTLSVRPSVVLILHVASIGLTTTPCRHLPWCQPSASAPENHLQTISKFKIQNSKSCPIVDNDICSYNIIIQHFAP